MTLRRHFAFIPMTIAIAGLVWACAEARLPGIAEVTAAGETAAVGTANADAADDPAIWRNPADPLKSLIVGTDKKAGLHVYGLDGRQLSFMGAGRVNNVDLATIGSGDRAMVLVAASDRNDEAAAKIALFRLDTATATLVPLGSVGGGAGEAYGICLWAHDGGTDAFIVLKDGSINQVAFDLENSAPAGRIVRTMKLATQSEGCVVDPRTRRLYVAEEDAGIWRFDAARDGSTAPIAVAKADSKALVADVEGLAIAPQGETGGWLVASSQGDNAYALYRLQDGGYAGRFRIAAGKFGAVSETDGIEVMLGDFGPRFPGGLMVVQDGDNAPGAQNFKLVAWDDVRKALGLQD